jgi:hypothetical protein
LIDGESIIPPIAAPITATPVTVFSRFAAAEFRPASAELVSASRRSWAKIFAVFGMFAMIAAVSAVLAISAMFRQSSANGEGDVENDRKEHFNGTKVFVAARSRAFTRMISVFPFRLRKEFHRL